MEHAALAALGGPEKRPATVAVVQSDRDISRMPGWDLYGVLAETPDLFTPRFFDERTFGGVLGAAGEFDAAIFGHNAIFSSPALLAALQAQSLPLNFVVLHQLHGLDFFSGSLDLRLETLPADTPAGGFTPLERDTRDEVVLNWPTVVETDLLPAMAVRYLRWNISADWHVVLERRERDQRYPVVVRTPATDARRVAVSTLLADFSDSQHAALVRNMLAFVAFGVPEIAVLDVVDAATSLQAATVARRLRYQGVSAVVLKTPTDQIADTFTAWPVRAAREVIAPAETFPDALPPELEDWLASGGRLVTVHGGSELRSRSGADDAAWVAHRWIAWYLSQSAFTWARSLSACRAVLQMMLAVQCWARIDPPVSLIANLLNERVDAGSVDGGSISVTAAALDVDGLLGGGILSTRTREEVRAWLRQAFEVAPVVDKLDIARCLHSPELFDHTLSLFAPDTVSAATVTRLRQAAAALASKHDSVACLPEINATVLAEVDTPRVLAQLQPGSLRSADFAAAWLECVRIDPSHALSANAEATGPIALDSLGRSNLFRDDDRLRAANAIALGCEARALLLYAQLVPGAALQLRPSHAAVSPSIIRSAAAEANQLRANVEIARQDVPALGNAVIVLSALAIPTALVACGVAAQMVAISVEASVLGVWAVGVTVMVAAAAIFRRALRDRQVAVAQNVIGALLIISAIAAAIQLLPRVPGVADATGVLVLIAIVIGGAAVLLSKAHLAPEWIGELLEVLSNPKGVVEWLRDRIG